MGFSNPIIGGGGALVYPSIHSPNFDVAVPTSSPTPSWAILKNGLAYFFGLILQGGTITGPDYIFNAQGLFFYSSTPAVGNLVAWFAPAAGSDQFGNTFTEGLNIGGAMQNIALIPLQNSAFNITSAISGTLQSIASLGSGDASQVIPGILGSLLLGTGNATKQTTVLGSPMGTGTAAYILLEAENDGNTDTAIITMGTASSPDSGTTIVYTPILTIGPSFLLLYNGLGGTTVVTKTSGSGNIAIPASAVSPGKGEAWGAGASTSGQSAGATTAMGGNGSGGYSAETTFPFTPGGNVAFSVPASANAVGGAPADCTLNNGLGLIVTAHSGFAGTGASLGAGAAASGNTIAFGGANGGARSTHATNAGGGGGAGASGPSGTGNHGAGGGPTSGGAGGLGVGGVNGGNGGAPNNNGTAGASPGAGGGGGGSDGSGAIGGHGQARLTYSIGAPGIIFSIAAASGTDQFGTPYPAGVVSPGIVAIEPGTATTPEVWHYVGGANSLGTTFGAGWSNTNSSNEALAFKLLAEQNLVLIKGLATSTAANTTPTFVLPAAYQPGVQQQFVCVENGGAAAVFKSVAVQANGDVLVSGGTIGGGNYSFQCLYSLDIGPG
jgi:hypothetical protein